MLAWGPLSENVRPFDTTISRTTRFAEILGQSRQAAGMDYRRRWRPRGTSEERGLGLTTHRFEFLSVRLGTVGAN